MIKSTLSFSLTNRWMVIAFALSVLASGTWCFINLKIEAYPDIADTNVTIITKYDGRSAEEVEQKITIPIEKALNGVPKVIARRSRTIFGLSVVQLNFEDGTDDYFARQQVFQHLQEAEIPEHVQPVLAPLTSAIGEIYRYVVEAPASYSPMDIRQLQDWVIIPKLRQTPGVADIATFGGPVKQFHILTSHLNLRKYGFSLQDIIDAVNRNNQNTGGGIISRGAQGFAVRGIGNIRGKEDIEHIVIKSYGGVPVFLKDVASVEISPPPPSGILGYTLTDDTVSVDLATEGIVLMRRHENPSEVLKALKAKIQELEDQDLPKDVNLKIIYDRSFLIDHSLETVGHTLLEGITIALLVIFFFLGSFRSALVIAITIPFSLLFAFLMMWLTDIPANLLSLGAIDFGIIVDGAGRMAENIIRRLEHATEDEKKQGFMHVCVSGAQEVGKEIFYCVLIIILAYLPIFTMQRVEGKLFAPMALTLSFALLGSMICALTVIPVLISYTYRNALVQKPSRKKSLFQDYNPIRLLQILYGKFLVRILGKSQFVLILAGMFVAGSVFYARNLGTEFLPMLDEGSIWMRCIFPAGTNLQETSRIAPKIRSIVSKYYPVEAVLTQCGRNDDGTDPIPSNRIEIMIVLKDYHLWSDTLSKADLIRKIQDQLESNIPGASISFGQPIIDQVMEIVTGTAAHLGISIIGDDLYLTRSKADTLLQLVQQTKGATGYTIEQEGPQAQIIIEFDRIKASRYGINVNEIEGLIEAAVGGKVIDAIYEGPKKFDIVIRYYAEERNTIQELEELQVFSLNGSLVPMKDVAKISFLDGQTNIYRLDGKRMVTVRTNIRDRDQGGFVAELQQKVTKQIHLPHGYKIVYGGQFENLERAEAQLVLAVPMTLIIVFIVLFLLFRSLTDTVIVFSCVPIAVSGGLVALGLRGYSFTISSGVGMISLFGISVMAGIMLLSFLNNSINQFKLHRLESQGAFPTINEIRAMIVSICVEQLRPVMMVLIVAILALLPAATSSGIGSDVQRPLATVIIGGLITTLVFAPVVIPCIYWLMRKNQQPVYR